MSCSTGLVTVSEQPLAKRDLALLHQRDHGVLDDFGVHLELRDLRVLRPWP